MKILILYDSVFGNTERIAFAMRDAVHKPHQATCVRPDAFSTELLNEIDLLVVGSPTRAFRPTAAIVSSLKNLPSDALSQGIHTAAFDTRVSVEEVGSKFLSAMVKLFGYAAQPIDKLLSKHGGTQIAEPAWFYVGDKEGPLGDGELERAAAWMGEMIARLPLV